MPYKLEVQEKIEIAYRKFCQTNIVDENKLDQNYIEIRRFFIKHYNELKESNCSKYLLDLQLGLVMYEFLKKQKDFNNYYESSYDFWKYLSVFVIPDIISDRFGIDKVEHFYKKNVRIYPFTLYWYIHLSWQGDRESTFEILKDHSTDEILQMIERPSRMGINIELYRKIMKKISMIDKKDRRIIVNGKKYTILEIIFMKNLSKLSITRPEIYPNGVDGYVDMLFEI